MKIVSFNINSLRRRLHQLQAIIDKYQPDIIGLQETKVANEEFPLQAVHDLGYQVCFHGQKTHYGVATLSRLPISLVQTNFSEDNEQAQARCVLTRHQLEQGPITVFNGYFPQGENRNHPTKFPAKRRFYENLMNLINSQSLAEPWIILGDFNIAPHDFDVGIDTAQDWLRRGDCSFLPEERDWYQELFDAGFIDCWRQLNPTNKDCFSWFNYRTRAFERTLKKGLRIDHILIQSRYQQCLVDAGIDYAIRGMQWPSDHVPVWAEIGL